MPRYNITMARYRETRALEMAIAGETWDVISSELGYADRSGAWKAAQRALRRRGAAAADHYVGLQLMELEMMMERAWPQAVDGSIPAAEVMLRCMDRRERLLGGYTPIARCACGAIASPRGVSAETRRRAADAHSRENLGYLEF